MTRSKRDSSGRLKSGKRCPEAQVGGCNYCVTGEYKREARRKRRRALNRIDKSDT